MRLNAVGWSFAGWSGAASGNVNTTITLMGTRRLLRLSLRTSFGGMGLGCIGRLWL